MRIGSYVLLGMVIGGSVAAAWLLMKPRDPVIVALPEDGEIEVVTALLYERDGWGAVPEFVVPKRYVAPILAALRPAEPQEYPNKWDEWCTLGRLRIRCRDGRVFEITWPDSGKNVLCFQVDGKRCVRGGEYKPTTVVSSAESQEERWTSECTLLARIVREIHQEKETGEPSRRLASCFEDLERSAGRKQPRIR